MYRNENILCGRIDGRISLVVIVIIIIRGVEILFCFVLTENWCTSSIFIYVRDKEIGERKSGR